MDIYLPIAGLSVNALVIVGLGGLVGLLTGMVGVGGGFLTTPILIFYGIPPAVAVASATTQITGTSISGVLAHRRRRGVDLRMGAVIIVGGVAGSVVGGLIFRLLQRMGQIDTVISILYVILLGSIGFLMAKEAATELDIIKPSRRKTDRPARRHNPTDRGAADALALLPVGSLHLAARAPGARLLLRPAHRPARHRRRLHHGAGDDLSARHVGAGRRRHVAAPDPVRHGRHHPGPRDHHPIGRYRPRRSPAAGVGRRRPIWRVASRRR